jgi:hypothetical protein
VVEFHSNRAPPFHATATTERNRSKKFAKARSTGCNAPVVLIEYGVGAMGKRGARLNVDV